MMAAREPTPWGSIAVLAIAIAACYYLHQSLGINVYSPTMMLYEAISPPWIGAIASGAITMLAVLAIILLAFKILVKFKWFRVHFRNRTAGGWILGNAIMLMLVYGTLGLWWGAFETIRILTA